MTLLKERLKEAVEKKENDIKNFVWLFPKNRDDNNKQESIKLINCTPEQLKTFHTHCITMLYNESKESLGRINVLKLIQDQSNRIGVELLLRSFEEDPKFDRFSFALSIDKFIEDNKDTIDPNISTIDKFMDVSKKYENLSLQLIKEGCIDKLGIFDNSHITRSFILRMGVWLNNKEHKELKNFTTLNKYTSLSKIEVIKKYLKLRDTDNLRINPTGLSLIQIKEMLSLKTKKYKDLTTAQLNTLRYRVLFDLNKLIKDHITKWETLRNQIELVAQSKNIKLD